MEYAEWEKTSPSTITSDVLWRMTAYRLALYASDLGWDDVTRLARDARTRDLADQLYRALGSIGANIAEGYSRGSGRDQARFLEYTLGSAREARDWYYRARHVLSDQVAQGRIDLLANIIRLLLSTIQLDRSRNIREETLDYGTEA